MTIKDGFKLGLGIFLAQVVVGLFITALTLPILYFIGSTVKDAGTAALLSGAKHE